MHCPPDKGFEIQILEVWGRARYLSVIEAPLDIAVSSPSRPWMDVFALPEKSNMAVTESDPDPKIRKMSITF